MQLRKKKLILPRLQLRLVAVFLCTACLTVQATAILVSFTLARLARELPNDGEALMGALPEFLWTNLLLGLCLLLPLTLGVGIVSTFKIAGPLYRFDKFLRDVRDGRQSEPCRLRRGDELQDLCTLLNEVTEPLRERARAHRAEVASRELDAVAAALPKGEETADRDHAPAAGSASSDRSGSGRG